MLGSPLNKAPHQWTAPGSGLRLRSVALRQPSMTSQSTLSSMLTNSTWPHQFSSMTTWSDSSHWSVTEVTRRRRRIDTSSISTMRSFARVSAPTGTTTVTSTAVWLQRYRPRSDPFSISLMTALRVIFSLAGALDEGPTVMVLFSTRVTFGGTLPPKSSSLP